MKRLFLILGVLCASQSISANPQYWIDASGKLHEVLNGETMQQAAERIKAAMENEIVKQKAKEAAQKAATWIGSIFSRIIIRF